MNDHNTLHPDGLLQIPGRGDIGLLWVTKVEFFHESSELKQII